MNNKQWKNALKKAEYQFYSSDMLFKREGDNNYTDIDNSNWRPSMNILGRFSYKYNKPSERMPTILDLISNFNCNNCDRIVIALNPNDIMDYEHLSQTINDGIQRMSCNNRSQVYIHNIRKRGNDININKLISSRYVIIPDDNFEIYDALIGMRDVCKNEIGLIVDEPKSNMIRVKNSIMTEITKLCSSVKINYHEKRSVYVTGEYNSIIRVLEELDNKIYKQEYTSNPVKSRQALDVMKDGILQGPLYFSGAKFLPNDIFEHGELKFKIGLVSEYPISTPYSPIKIGIEYIPNKEMKLPDREEDKEPIKSAQEELEDIRRELIEEYKERTFYSKDNLVEREQLTRMIKNISDSLK